MADFGQAYVRGRLVGKLVGFHNADKGYAFLSTGPNTPQYFVHRSDVPPQHWHEGALLEFTPAPPKPGSKNMRAADITPYDIEEQMAS